MRLQVVFAALAGVLLGVSVALIASAEPSGCVGEMKAGETTPPILFEGDTSDG